MIKRLTTIGNSLGLIIDKPILELLGIGRHTPLSVSTDGRSIVIQPLSQSHTDRVLGSTEKMMDQHDEILGRLEP